MAISAADLMVTFKADTKDAEAGMQRMNKGVTGFAKSAAAMGAGVLGAAVFSDIARGFSGAGTAALDFGKNMANVNSIAQLSDGAFAKLNDQVLALTSDPRIAQAPATLAAGLYDIYSSGFQGADGLKVLQQSALAATAGVTDTATAARAITASLNAFGLGAGDAQRVSDVLFQTVNDGVITFDQLANNLGNTIPIANALGLSIEDVGAAYAQMTLKGVPAAQAETQIAGLMRSALNPTQALTDAVQAHGFASATDAIKQKGLAGFLDIVNDAAGGNQETMFDLLGTQEAMNAATILGADGAKNYRKELDKMNGASKGAGATNKALEKQMQSASFQIAKMKQQVLTLATVGFGILAPVIGKAAGAMTRFLSRGVIPFTKAIGAALKGGFAFDKMITQLPQPLRRAAHAVGVMAEAVGDMIRGGISKGELTQFFHGFQAFSEELSQGVHFVANIIVDAAVSLGSLLIGGAKAAPGMIFDWVRGKLFGQNTGQSQDPASPMYNMKGKPVDAGVWDVAVRLGSLVVNGIAGGIGNLWDWVKGKLLGGGGSVSQDPASPMYGTAGQSIDMGAWTLNVAAPAVVSAVGDLGAWVNRYIFNQTNNQDVGPVAWQLNLSLPSIGWPASFASGQQAGEYIRGKLGAISLNNVSWKMALAVPLILMGAPAVIGGLIVKRLTGIGPIELTRWTLTVLAPSAIAFAGGVAAGLIPNAIRSALSTANIAVKGFTAWTLNVGTAAAFTVAWTAEQIAARVKTTIGVLPAIKIPMSLTVDLTIDVVKHVKSGAEGIWDFLTGHITPLSAGGMPGGMGFQQPDVNVTSNLNVTASLDLAAWNQSIAQVKADTDAYNGKWFYAFFGIDNGDAVRKYTDSMGWGGVWGNSTFTSTFDINNGPAAVKYSDVNAWGAAWAASLFTSIFDINIGPAAVEYTNAFAMGYAWAGQVFTASFSVDVSGLYAAQAVAYQVAANIAAIMPHSPANALKSAELIKLIKKAENGDSIARGLGRELGMSGGF
jgi:TP901 family phage tail tape measure protein